MLFETKDLVPRYPLHAGLQFWTVLQPKIESQDGTHRSPLGANSVNLKQKQETTYFFSALEWEIND